MRTRFLFRAIGIVVIVGLTARGAFIMRSLNRTLEKTQLSVEARDRRIRAVERVQSLAIDLETGVRGWVLTHERSFREPYDQGVATAPAVLAELDAVVSDEGHAHASAVKALLAAWDERVAKPLLRPDADLTAAERLALHESGKRTMDAVRSELAALRASSAAEDPTTRLKAELGQDLLVDVVVFTGALLTLFVLMGVAIVRMIERPLAVLAQVATGTLPLAALAEPRGVREVKEVARAFRTREERLQSERARERRFAELLGVLVQGGELEAIAESTLRHVVDDQGALYGAIWLARNEALERVAVVGVSGDPPASPPAVVEEACAAGRKVVLRDADLKGAVLVRTTAADVIPRTIVVVPLLVGGRATGAIELGGPVEAERASELEEILPRLALALANAVAAEEVARMGQTLARSNEELSAQNEELRAQEDELRAQRSLLLENEAKMEQQTEELERASHAKTDFLATVSHELRTPLNAIIGFTDVLLDGKQQADSDQGRYLLEVRAAARHLHQLVDDLLDLGRIEAGVLDLELTSLLVREYVDSALSLTSGDAARRGVTVRSDVEQGLRCVADARRLKQVLTNVIANAIKFTPRNGSVHVRARAHQGYAHVEVADSGPGIRAVDIPRLFQRFSQLEAGRAAKTGFGLGLAISKRLVDRMNGRIGVLAREDAPGGATFYVELPLASAAHVAVELRPASPRPPLVTSAPQRPSLPGRARRALVVSARPDEAVAVADLLGREGYASDVVARATDADDAIARASFDVVVVDLEGADAQALVERATNRLGAAVLALTDGPRRASELARVEACGAVVLERGVMTGGGFVDLLDAARTRAVQPLVMIVDDNAVNRRVARAMLEDAKYRVVEAEDAETALDVAQRLRPSVVLMDIRMPGMDGLEATRRLNGDARTASIPVVALSAQAMAADRAEALAAGCFAYVTKPVSRHELVRAVDAARKRAH